MKKMLSILCLCLLYSCIKNADVTETKAAKNQKLITTYFKHFNNHNWKELAGMYSETAIFKDPSFGNKIVNQTRVQTLEKYSELNKLFPDLKDKVLSIYPSGENHVVIEFISTGTAPDNSKFELPICTIFTIENEKITKDFTYYDNFEQ